MKIDAASIDELIEKSGPRRATLEALDRFIGDTVPSLDRRLFAGPSITMIGYGAMPWKRASGSGIWPVISLAPQKGSVNLYIAGDDDGVSLPQRFKDQLGNVSLGKNCVRVRRMESVDLAGLAALLRAAEAWAQTKENTYGRNCAVPVDTP